MEKNAILGEGKDLMGALWNLIMVDKFSNYSCKKFTHRASSNIIRIYFASMQRE